MDKMTDESLRPLALPQPGRDVLKRTREVLDRFLPEVMPRGETWSLGGGTALAGDWKHRESTDIDIKVPRATGIERLDTPEFRAALIAKGSGEPRIGRLVVAHFRKGRIEIYPSDPIPATDLTRRKIDGRSTVVQSPTQILTGKFGRSLTPPGRDLYDFAIAGRVDPENLTRAVNTMDPGWLEATLRAWQDDWKSLAKEVEETISGVPQWAEKYLDQPVAYAITGILENSTRRLEVATRDGSARMVCHTAKGPRVFEYASVEELERGLTNSGIGLILARKGRTGDEIKGALLDAMAGDRTETVSVTGTETFHRLNRAEYRNAFRDLLQVEVDVSALLPADDADVHGFDNMAAALSVSSALLERYLSAARRISRLAVGIAPPVPSVETHRIPLLKYQDERLSEDLLFGSRGGIAIRHRFRVDGEYSTKLRLQRTYSDYIRGLGTPQALDVRVDGVLIERFIVGGGAPSDATAAPASFAANTPLFGHPDWEAYVLGADENLEVIFRAEEGERVVDVSFEHKHWEAEGPLQPRQTGFPLAINERWQGDAAVDSVEIGGPYTVDGPDDTARRRAIFNCHPDRGDAAPACAREILSRLAKRAYRRPVTERDLDVLLDFYEGRRRTEGFEAGVQLDPAAPADRSGVPVPRRERSGGHGAGPQLVAVMDTMGAPGPGGAKTGKLDVPSLL